MTIPSSINLPIFTENERKIIGTEYMKGSKEKAKLLGITYAKDKLVSFLNFLKNIKMKVEKFIFFVLEVGLDQNLSLVFF